jgi:hypothetical protein
MTLWSTQTVTEMSTRNLPGSKRRPVRKANNRTAISEPLVTWVFMACYRNSFAFYLYHYTEITSQPQILGDKSP